MNKSSSEPSREASAHELFLEFHQKIESLSKEQADSKKELIKSEIKALNAKILKSLEQGIPSSITQDQLIEWTHYVLTDFHQFSNDPKVNKATQDQFTSIITSKEFFDRIIFGKGAEGYNEDSKNHQDEIKKGIKFVESIFNSGPPEGKPFQDHLGKIRISLDKYLSSVSYFDKNENKEIPALQKAQNKAIKRKWKELHHYMDEATKSSAKDKHISMESDYTQRFNTVIYLFAKTTAPLPDFITRDDIVKLVILDPARFSKLPASDSLLRLVGDINEFKNSVELKMTELKDPSRNVLIDEKDVKQALSSLEKAAQSKIERTKNYTQTLDESTTLLAEINSSMKTWGDFNQNRLQMDTIRALDSNATDLKLDPIKQAEYDAYVAQVKQADSTQSDDKSASINMTKSYTSVVSEQLQARLNTLKEMAITIEADIKYKNTRKIEIEPSLLQARDDIQKKIVEIEKINDKLILLNSHDQLHNQSLAEQKNDSAGYKFILYQMLMTRKSISEGNPSREYLNSIYSDTHLNSFLHHEAPEYLKRQVKLLDQDLIYATAEQLRIKSSEIQKENKDFEVDPLMGKKVTIASSSAQPNEAYINSKFNEILNQIEACRTDWSRKKINSFWVKVMEQAYINNDLLTLHIVKTAVDTQKNPVFFRSTNGRLAKLNKQLANDTAWQSNNFPSPKIIPSQSVTPELKAVETETKGINNTFILIEKIEAEKHLRLMTMMPKSINDANELASNIINYLELIKSKWDALEIDDKAHNKQVLAPRELIDDTIRALESNPSFSDIKLNLNLLQNNLSSSIDTPKAFKLFRFRSSNNDYTTEQLSQMNADIHAISEIEHSIETFTQKNKLAEVKIIDNAEITNIDNSDYDLFDIDPEVKPIVNVDSDDPIFKLLVDNPDEDESKHNEDSLLLEDPTELDNEPSENQPYESKNDFFLPNANEEYDELSPLTKDWIVIDISSASRQACARAERDADLPISRALPIEYKHRGTGTQIRETQENDRIKIDVTDEPEYETTDPVKIANIEFIIADAIINLLVNRCGKSNPIEILDSPNKTRICALALVCQERGLTYTFQNPANSLVADSENLNNRLETMKTQITETTRNNAEKSRNLPAVNKEISHPTPRMH